MTASVSAPSSAFIFAVSFALGSASSAPPSHILKTVGNNVRIENRECHLHHFEHSVLSIEQVEEWLIFKHAAEIIDDEVAEEIFDDEVMEEIIDDEDVEEIIDNEVAEEFIDDDVTEEIFDEKVTEEIIDDEFEAEIIDAGFVG